MQPNRCTRPMEVVRRVSSQRSNEYIRISLLCSSKRSPWTRLMRNNEQELYSDFKNYSDQLPRSTVCQVFWKARTTEMSYWMLLWRGVGNIYDRRVYDALEKDEGELLRLLQAVAVSTSATEMVLSLRGRRAQQFMDIVQDVLSHPNPQQPTSTQLRLRLLYLVTNLSYHCGEPRFSGSFGDVFLASLHGVPVALKRMRPIWTSLNPDDIEAMRQKHCREALIWQHLSHPNLLPFIGIDNKTFHPTPCLVSPWIENGTVMSYLRKRRGVNVAQLLFEVAQGLEYLHSMKVCHGDLRGSNVLVDNDGHARIADFGLVPLYALASAGEYSGSLRWTAPEVIRSKIHGKCRLKRMPAGDIYSFGCLCVELNSLQPPFDGISEVNVVMLVLDGIPPPRPAEMEDEMWTLVQDCLCPDFCNRPRASALVGRMGATKTSSI
ncbi:kinase-like protein [Pleurotus eryngii]|uniref:Kinase-like protein n=1 Tax=Pleurotus eryngii TaxID=5323 RepID=A0A9P6A501_PLEER|nr:kinase-like protein [Pleurotus eryngii]